MKKKVNKIYLTEEEASLGFLCPEGARTTAIPICNVCQNWDGPGKCKKLGRSLDIYRRCERRDCPEAILDTKIFGFPRFAELYPEDTKKLLERQKQAGEKRDDKNHP